MSIRSSLTPIGPVHVRMTGVVRGDEKGPGVEIINAPTAAEATAELHRVARVQGADKVVSVAADYRRAAIVGGVAGTQWRIDVQAWGTAMAPVKAEPSDEAERQDSAKADKAKQDQSAKDATKDHDADPAKDASAAATSDAAKTDAGADPSTSEASASVASVDAAQPVVVPVVDATSTPTPETGSTMAATDR